MEEQRVPVIEIDVDGNLYTIDWNLESVKAFAQHSLAHGGRVPDAQFLKFALQKHHSNMLITEKMCEYIQQAMVEGARDSDMSYMEILTHIVKLYVQAIDDAARDITPAVVQIEKDNSVLLTVGLEKYKLTFTRSDIQDALIGNSDVFNYNNMLELYIVGSALIKLAMNHYKKRFSVRVVDNLFLSLWATKFSKATEDDFAEVINALRFHMSEVLESGSKNSKAVIRLKPTQVSESNLQLVE